MKLEELKQYDGKEGRPAYIVYKGDIYDVTGSYGIAFWMCAAMGAVGLGLILTLGSVKPDIKGIAGESVASRR